MENLYDEGLVRTHEVISGLRVKVRVRDRDRVRDRVSPNPNPSPIPNPNPNSNSPQVIAWLRGNISAGVYPPPVNVLREI